MGPRADGKTTLEDDRRARSPSARADRAPGQSAASHLAWLRDELGERFLAGVVLHTGKRVYTLGERLSAAPICTLWA
jgi:hypothetical protein